MLATVCNLAKETGVSSFSRLIDVTTWLNFQDGFGPRVIVPALTKGIAFIYGPEHSCLRLEVTFTAVI